MSKPKRHKKGYVEDDDVIDNKRNRKPKSFGRHVQEKHLNGVLKSGSLDLDRLEDVIYNEE